METQQIVLASRPKGTPTTDNFRFEKFKLQDLKDNQVVLEPIFYSVDPYMRGRMNDTKSYAPPFQVDAPIYGSAIAKVLLSKSIIYKEGDMVSGILPWRDKTVADAKDLSKIEESKIPVTYYIDVLGMTGLTAYFGLMKIGKPKAGETVVVSAAAGAVGLIVCQIAKLHDCRVVGIAGTDDKVALLKNKYGLDEAINYKTTEDIKKAISESCPHGVDIYFDSVGGEISDAVLPNINFQGRIVLCGQIALYNKSEVPTGPRWQPTLLTKSITMQGFIVSNFKDQFSEGFKHFKNWIENGKIKSEQTIIQGFDQLPTAFLGLFKGENVGKMIVAGKNAFPDYPHYPASEDIYSQEEEVDLPQENVPHATNVIASLDERNEIDFWEDLTAEDLDIPGSTPDEKRPNSGEEDEENNYYSLGGDNHNDLEEDKG